MELFSNSYEPDKNRAFQIESPQGRLVVSDMIRIQDLRFWNAASERLVCATKTRSMSTMANVLRQVLTATSTTTATTTTATTTTMEGSTISCSIHSSSSSSSSSPLFPN